MKKLTYIVSSIILSVVVFRGYTQNLVPNYSFEDTLQCPFLPGQVSFAPPWYVPTGGSSDYFNSCNNAPFDNGLFGVPDNFEGKQTAKTGKAYTGLGTYSIGMDIREYIQTKLINQLSIGNKYCVEFYASLADTAIIAAHNLGMYFSDTAISGSLFQVLNVIPQISNDIFLNPLTDKVGWINVSGSFIANGTENYITIGNFLNDANTDTTHLMGGSDLFSYYYIDDVSVKCCDCDTSKPSKITVPNVFTPNNDGMNDEWEINNLPTGTHIKIYNRWGIAIVGEEAVSMQGTYKWDGRTTAGLACNDDIYYYVITASEKTYQGFIQLVK